MGNYSEIVELCKKYDLRLILDAAHMAGTRMRGVIPGREADVVVYSFQAVKNLPTADSGMICFMNAEFDKIVRKKCWLGINKDTYSRTIGTGKYKWRYNVEYVGDKGHGNSIMASIGLVQLKYLDRDNYYRRELASLYTDRFKSYIDKIKLVRIEEGCVSSCHLFQIIVEKRDELMIALNSVGIYPGVHYVCNTNYDMYSYGKGTCPNAEYISEHTISLPLNLCMSYEDVHRICDAVIDFFG